MFRRSLRLTVLSSNRSFDESSIDALRLDYGKDILAGKGNASVWKLNMCHHSVLRCESVRWSILCSLGWCVPKQALSV